MKLRYHWITLILLISSNVVFAQSQYPNDYFRSPVDFPIVLSGTFGELRTGHFHSGMDIKTGGVSGKMIYAVADGYVSRIKVSAFGFGKTLYVTHPNGFVSVYAHLSGFNKPFAAFVKQEHYKRESFEIDVYLDKGQFPVKKGEVIAYSGNSGGSNGPHLHFEMRLESTQTPVNPLLFGFKVKDFIRPEIKYIKVIPTWINGTVDGKAKSKDFVVEGWGEAHRLRGNDTVDVAGPFARAVYTHDKLNDANNKNGVYSISITVDGEQYYFHDLEKFDFSETRYVNSLIDYAEYVENSRRYQRSEIDPNNKLSIYKDVLNHGIFHFTDDGCHRIEYIIRDFAGNVSRLPIIVRALPDPGGEELQIHEPGHFMPCCQDASFHADGFEMNIPQGALYRDLDFEYSTLDMPSGAFSRIHRLHNDLIPLQSYCTIRIRPDKIPEQTDKLVLVRISEDKAKIYSGGKWEDGVLSARIRDFGDYMIVMDTTPPGIASVNISSGIIGPERKTVKLKIDDKLSGISTYRATLNGKWLLMDYDAKSNLLVYDIDERLVKGNNSFRLVVTDNAGNEAVFEKTLVR